MARSNRVDAADFIVAFFRCWVNDSVLVAYYGQDPRKPKSYNESRTWLFCTQLRNALEAFNYSGEIAYRFRLCYLRWERSRHTAWRLADAHRGEKWEMHLKQEVNQVMEIAEAIEALSEASRQYLLELLNVERTFVPHAQLKRGRNSYKKSDFPKVNKFTTSADLPSTTEDLEETTSNDLPSQRRQRHVVHNCCGSKQGKHLNSCRKVISGSTPAEVTS